MVFETEEGVYEPAEDTILAAEHLSHLLESARGSRISVLDMGCGTGFLGLLAARSENVASVLLCDVNGRALALAEKNFKSNRPLIKADCSFIKTDLFSKIPASKTFDLMIFNTPYLPNEHLSPRLASDETAWNGGEKGIEVAEAFLRDAVPHLVEGGRVLLVSSSFADVPELLRKAKAMGYEKVEERKKHVFFEDMVSLLLQTCRSDSRAGKQK